MSRVSRSDNFYRRPLYHLRREVALGRLSDRKQISELVFQNRPQGINPEAGFIALGTLRGLLTSVVAGVAVSDLLFHFPVHGLAWRIQENLENLSPLEQFAFNHGMPLGVGMAAGLLASPVISKIVGPRQKSVEPHSRLSTRPEPRPDALQPTPSKQVAVVHKEATPHGETLSGDPDQIVASKKEEETVDVAPSSNGKIRIGRYVLLRQIGQGGFGQIYEAYQEDQVAGVGKRRVAVKLLKVGMIDHLPRFIGEIKVLQQLNHPNIVTYLDSGRFEENIYLVTEFIEGKTLSAILDENKKLSLEEALKYAVGVTRALEHAYVKGDGLIHRDITPNNIMIMKDETLDYDGRVKVIDFGLVRKQGGEGLTVSGGIIGTPRYMSPERASGKSENEDHRSDMYCLGLIMYAMITGRRPFDRYDGGDSLQLINAQQKEHPYGIENFDGFNALNRAVSRELWGILRRLLDKKKENRFSDYKNLRETLEKELGNMRRIK